MQNPDGQTFFTIAYGQLADKHQAAPRYPKSLG